MSVGREGYSGGGGRRVPAGGGGRGGDLNSLHQLEFCRRMPDWRLYGKSASPENLPDMTELEPKMLQPSKLRQPKSWSLSSSPRTQMASKIAAVFPTPSVSSERSGGRSKLIQKTCETSTGDSKLTEKNCKTNAGHSKLTEKNCKTNAGHSKLTEKNCKTNAGHSKLMEKNYKTNAGHSKLTEKNCETSTGNSNLTDNTFETNVGNSKLIEITSAANTDRSKFCEANSDGSKLTGNYFDTNKGDSKLIDINSRAGTSKFCEANSDGSKFTEKTFETNKDSSKLTEKIFETNTGDSKLIEITAANTVRSKLCETNSGGSKLIEKTCERNMNGSKMIIEDEIISCFDQTYSVDERYRSKRKPRDSAMRRETKSVCTPSQFPADGTEEVWTEPLSPTLLDMDVVSASFLHQHSLEEPTDEASFTAGAHRRAHSSQADLAGAVQCGLSYSAVTSKPKKNKQTLKEALLPPPANQRHMQTFSTTGATNASTTSSKMEVTSAAEQNTKKLANNSRPASNDNVRGNRDDNYRNLRCNRDDKSNEGGNRDDSCGILRDNHRDSSKRGKRDDNLSFRGNRDDNLGGDRIDNYRNLGGNRDDSCGIPRGNHHETCARDEHDDSLRCNRDDNHRQRTNEMIPTDISGQWGDLVEEISRVWRNRQQDVTFNNNTTNACSNHDENVDSNHNNDYVGGNCHNNNVYVGSSRDDNVYVGSNRNGYACVGGNHHDNAYVGNNQDDEVYVGSNHHDNVSIEYNFNDYDEQNYTFYGNPSLAQHQNEQIDFTDTHEKNLESVDFENKRLKTEFIEMESDVASPNWKYGEVHQNYAFVEPNDANGFYEQRQGLPTNNTADNRFEQNSNGQNWKTQQNIIRREIHTTIDCGNNVYVVERTSIFDPNVLENGGSINYYGNYYSSNHYGGNHYESTPFEGNRYEGYQYRSNGHEGNHFESNPYDNYIMHGQNSDMFSPQGLNAFVSVQRPVFMGNRSTLPTSLDMPWPGRQGFPP